jgi:integrase
MTEKIGVYRDKRNKSRPWIVRWYGASDENTGKRRRYCETFRTKAGAEDFKASKMGEFKQGQRRGRREQVLLKAFCADWLKIRSRELRPETVKLYKQTIARLLSYFGQRAVLSQVSPRSAAKFVGGLERMDAKDGELSNWTRHRTLRQCKTMFDSAVEWDLIASNPFKKIKSPKCVPTDWHYLSPDQYCKLLNVAPTLRRRAFYALAYTTGLRKGELVNLRWENVDFGAGEVKVRNQAAAGKFPPFSVKDYEARTIPLPEHTLEILRDLQAYNEITDQTLYVLLDERQLKTAVAKWWQYRQEGRDWRNEDMVNNTGRDFKRHLERAGITAEDSLSIHTLRKACILNWANNINNMEVVRVLAGHSSLTTTMKYYSQITADQRAKAAAAIDELLRQTDVKVTYGANYGPDCNRE